MVEMSYCLDLVVPEGTSKVLKRLINGAPSTPGKLLALLRELWHVLQALTEVIEIKQVQKTNQIRILYQITKNGRKISHHVSNQQSL